MKLVYLRRKHRSSLFQKIIFQERTSYTDTAQEFILNEVRKREKIQGRLLLAQP